MAESKCSCRAVSSEKSCRKSTTFVPVVGDVICEAPGVLYVSIDPDVWRIRCQQCQQKTEHKCPLKKLKRKFKSKADDRRRKLGDSDDDEDGKDKGKKEKEDEENGEDGAGQEEGDMNSNWNDMCQCSDRPARKPRPKVCYCSPYLPVNFLLEVEVTGEQKPEYKKKRQREA